MKKTLSEVTFMAPVPIPKQINHPFGEKRSYEVHPGVDLGVPSGTDIKAPADGIVKTADPNHNNKCGGTIDIDYGNGFWSRFCHVKKLNVRVGDMVRRGQVVGLTGGGANDPGRGNSKGPHLHFTLKKDGRLVDPMQYVDRFDVGTQEFPMSGATQSQDRSYWDEFFSKDSSSVATPKKNIVDPLLGKILDPLEKALNLKFENKNFIKKLTEEFDLTGGELESSTSYSVNAGKKMICPEKGEVKIISKNDNCDQMVLIKHDLSEGVMYSKFCNVQTKLVKGQKISSGTPVGIAKENASIEILDRRSQKLSLKDILGKKKDSQKKYQVDPLLNLALKPLEKTLNLLPKPESVSGKDQSEPHKFIKWLKQDSVSKKDPIKEELQKFKKLL